MTEAATAAAPADAPSPDGAARPTPAITRLVLARHAVTAETGPLLSGRQPGIDLSEEGVRQAEALADRLTELPVAAVYTSPIERTTQTARRVADRHHLPVESLEGVLEADYGEWTGQKLAELAKTDLWKVVQRAPSRAAFPGGESLAAMQARMVAALDAVVAAHPGELVVVVSHADPIKAAVAHYTGVHLDLFQRIMVDPASVTVIRYTAGRPFVVRLNDSGAALSALKPQPRSRRRRPRASDADAAVGGGGGA
jgi:probable phosphomutase (TIGR03848 family)